MSTLYYIPIEPLEERYTEQWYREFPTHFRRHFNEVVVIEGETLTSTIVTGAFLDLNSTMYYKASQVQRLAKLFFEQKIKANDIFFIADLEFPGIEALRYMADLQGIKIIITGFLHAASYTIEDYFEKAAPYGQHFERGWIRMCDIVFVGSEYHRSAVIIRRQLQPPYRIIVSGNPLNISEVLEQAHSGSPHDRYKDKTIIFSNRFDTEKRPNLFLDAATILKAKYPDWKFLITTSSKSLRSNSKGLLEYARVLEKNGVVEIKEGLSKTQYYQELLKAAIFVSTTIEENFGYCTLEAMILGTIPVVPNKFSHPEIVKASGVLYDNFDNMLESIEKIIQERPVYKDTTINRYDFKHVVNLMAEEIKTKV